MERENSVPRDARRWALDLLGAEEQCETTELLRRISNADYLLPAAQVDAIQIVADSIDPTQHFEFVDRAVLEGRRQRVVSDINRFLSSYVATSGVTRRRHWRALVKNSVAFPDLAQWLKHLKPEYGLDDIPQVKDVSIQQFIDQCWQGFIGRNPDRARQRQAIIEMYFQDPDRWHATRKLLGKLDHTGFQSRVVPWFNEVDEISELNAASLEPLPTPPKYERQESWREWWSSRDWPRIMRYAPIYVVVLIPIGLIKIIGFSFTVLGWLLLLPIELVRIPLIVISRGLELLEDLAPVELSDSRRTDSDKKVNRKTEDGATDREVS